MNLTTFFAYARRAPFGGRLLQTQIDGMKAIMALPWASDNELAYALATTFHETGATMQPIREKGGSAYFKKYEWRTDLGNVKAGDGVKYHGRGYVQITGRKNYSRAAKLLGADLLGKPDLALRPDYAATILYDGMTKGWFTGRRLDQHFNATKEDPEGARRIVNGADKAALIAGYYRNFLDSIKAARANKPEASDSAKADDIAPLDSASIKTALTGLAGTTGVSLITGISSPWAFAALALIIVAFGTWLVVTGRVELKRKAA